jgi:hypothetical protein
MRNPSSPWLVIVRGVDMSFVTSEAESKVNVEIGTVWVNPAECIASLTMLSSLGYEKHKSANTDN